MASFMRLDTYSHFTIFVTLVGPHLGSESLSDADADADAEQYFGFDSA